MLSKVQYVHVSPLGDASSLTGADSCVDPDFLATALYCLDTMEASIAVQVSAVWPGRYRPHA